MSNPLLQFKLLEGEFEKVVKRYNQSRELSKDEEILNSYRSDLQSTYNEIVEFINNHFASLDSLQRESIKQKLLKIRDKLIISYQILNINQEVPTDFTKKITIPSLSNELLTEESDIEEDISETDMINENNDPPINDNNDPLTENITNTIVLDSDSSSSNESNSSNQRTNSEIGLGNSSLATQNIVIQATMTTPVEFLRLAGHQIKNNFDGNPLELDSFLNSIE